MAWEGTQYDFYFLEERGRENHLNLKSSFKNLCTVGEAQGIFRAAKLFCIIP